MFHKVDQMKQAAGNKDISRQVEMAKYMLFETVKHLLAP
jgi:hypothetical protein